MGYRLHPPGADASRRIIVPVTAKATTVRANGIEVYFERQGPSDGVPLVMAHGFASCIDWWREEAKPRPLPLPDDRPLLLYDVRGHGRTEVPPEPARYSMPTFAADLAALLRELGIERADIGGSSMGGMIAAQFAVDFPAMVRSLLLCDTTAGNGQSADAAGQWEARLAQGAAALAHLAGEHGLEETLRREHEYARQNDPHWDIRPVPPEMDYRRLKLMTVPGYVGAALAIAERPDLTPRLSEIAVPTLVMAGEWDDFFPCAVRDRGLIRGSRMVVRKECAHGYSWRPDTFREEIARFLDDVDAGRPVAAEREV